MNVKSIYELIWEAETDTGDVARAVLVAEPQLLMLVGILERYEVMRNDLVKELEYRGLFTLIEKTHNLLRVIPDSDSKSEVLERLQYDYDFARRML
jgi:hypothetical protein